MQDEKRNPPLADAASSLPVTAAANQPDLPRDPAGRAVEQGWPAEPAPTPAWAKDLRELYNAVVEEPLPDSFLALLAQLDTKD